MTNPVQPRLPMPTTKKEAQAVLRKFDIFGAKVDAIEDDRIYILAPAQLTPVGDDFEMRRAAKTIVLVEETEEETGIESVRAIELDGWVVPA